MPEDARRHKNKKTIGGFTLIELLVVIAVIGLLASVILVSLNDSRKKSRDAKRMADIDQIYKALNLFYDKYGCLPTTAGSTCVSGYAESNAGGWDYSSQGSFMTFLVASGYLAKPPVDPINNMTGDGIPSRTYAYRYYCYPSGASRGLHLGYWRESDNQYVLKNIKNSNNWADSGFVCK